MSKKEKESLLPRLRFSEFQVLGTWEIIHLNSIAVKITTKNKEAFVTRVLTNSAVDGVVDQSDYFEREIITQSNIGNYLIIDEGDYVYNPRISSSAPVGPVSKNKIGRGVISPLYTIFRFNSPQNDFYEQYFKTNLWNCYLKTVSNTGARHDRISITADKLMEMPLPSSSIKEQQKIADCLSSLDDLITAENKKLLALRNHKKGLMQNLFPAEGNTVPKRRFSEFQGEWITTSLANVTDKKIKWSFTGGPFGSNLKSSDYTSNGIRVIQLQNIGDGKYVDTYRIFTSEEKADELLSCNIYSGEIIMSKMGDPVGRACLIPNIHTRYLMCSDGIRLVVDEEHNNKYFIYSLINSDAFRSVIENNATGSTRKRIGLDVLKNLPMVVPKEKEEQQKIADCLSSLDATITAQSEKIKALKAHKKGLMQGLFPSIEEVDV